MNAVSKVFLKGDNITISVKVTYSLNERITIYNTAITTDQYKFPFSI